MIIARVRHQPHFFSKQRTSHVANASLRLDGCDATRGVGPRAARRTVGRPTAKRARRLNLSQEGITTREFPTVGFSILLFCSLGLPISSAQELLDQGIYANGVLARTRLGGTDFYLGDLMYVSALQPANTGGMYVSAHMEYLDEQGKWRPVPTSTTELGQQYHSPNYAGLRDFVKFNGTSINTIRHICLFMPFDAAALQVGERYQRRYVIRVWDGNNREISNHPLEAERVQTSRDEEGKLLITTVTVRACGGAQYAEDLQPVPETVDTGHLAMFSVKSGRFGCPATSAPAVSAEESDPQ